MTPLPSIDEQQESQPLPPPVSSTLKYLLEIGIPPLNLHAEALDINTTLEQLIFDARDAAGRLAKLFRDVETGDGDDVKAVQFEGHVHRECREANRLLESFKKERAQIWTDVSALPLLIYSLIFFSTTTG